ncbi:four helix bundle protein [Arthrospiribacter ruber]|uniref:Four helix bundle protein n=1 Tax=Arthrospiribacter ruber TaxID=2487934 RepID=A0A951J2U4_9BACT|nr:four helix bundle protein [Arthrospiribacter ruber]MBW3470434.1 four helix bundle protein [Arthrospiribacter ruber]
MEKSRNYGENDRFEFIKQIQDRSKVLALEVIKVCDKLPSKRSSSVISYQIIKSATSQAANYRAACRARSGAEFFSKISIVVEEADETCFWLEMLFEAKLIDVETFQKLFKESEELLSIFSTARKNAKLNK